MLTTIFGLVLSITALWCGIFFALVALKLIAASRSDVELASRTAGGFKDTMLGRVKSRNGNVCSHLAHAGLEYHTKSGKLIEQGMISDDAVAPILKAR